MICSHNMMKTPEKIINQKLKPPKAFFDWCYRQIPTFIWSNKLKTICASERTDCPIVRKRLMTTSNLFRATKFYPFAIILVTNRRIEIQSYGFWSTVSEGKQTIEYRLTNFECFTQGNHYKFFTWDDGEVIQGLMRNYGLISSPYTNTKFYPNNWQEKVQTISELKYLEFKRLERWQLAHIYKYRNEIEFLQKIKATNMANEVMYPREEFVHGKWLKTVDMRMITKKWLHKNKAKLKNNTQTFSEFKLEEFFKTRKGKKVNGIEEYLNYRDFSKIPKNIGITRFQRWIIKNEIDFSYYLDYLHLLKELKIPLESEIVLLPKDLRKAHDDCVDKLNQIKREIEAHEYEERLQQVLKLEREIGDYVVLAPHELNELMKEGNVLHHCVGGSHYIESHKNGATTILFLRKKDKKEQPLYTIEYRNKHIIQIRGLRNSDPTPEVQEVADKWLESVLSKKGKGK